MKKRVEKDFLGGVEVPTDAYYGSFTERAKENFKISGTRIHFEFIKALAIIKKAAAEANSDLKLLDEDIANSIVKAANEVITGKFNDHFIVDIYQAGAGTPYNMNMNEIIANRATEFLRGKLGTYIVHPNNHVNMGQSSNDVIPTAIRIASLLALSDLIIELKKLIDSFKTKAREFDKILKVGRTHLRDAVPIRLGQEFNAYANIIERNANNIDDASIKLKEVPLGGTAIGTGINTHPKFKELAIKDINLITGINFRSTKDPIELTQSMNVFTLFSSTLKTLAIDLVKICNDLVILNSGPRAGLNEISLPEVEPGSSIMPGKVNPSIPEAVTMVCYQVMGYDHSIDLAAKSGTLELNVMTPLIAYNLLQSIKILINSVRTLRERCVDGIKANDKRCRDLLEESVIYATALNPYLGYEVTAELVREAIRENKNIRKVVASKKIMTNGDLNKILSLYEMTEPHSLDLELITIIKSNKNYKAFLKKIKK